MVSFVMMLVGAVILTKVLMALTNLLNYLATLRRAWSPTIGLLRPMDH